MVRRFLLFLGTAVLWLFIAKVKIMHDTRGTHKPGPVVLPTRVMTKASDRIRLIRQGDNRELAVFESAVKKVRIEKSYHVTYRQKSQVRRTQYDTRI